jgi:integrase
MDAWDTVLDRVTKKRWAGTRNERTMLCQAGKAIETLRGLAVDGPDNATEEALDDAVDEWLDEGYAWSTVNSRLSALSCLGVNVPKGTRPRRKKVLKWWLPPDELKAVMAVCPTSRMSLLIRLIYFTGMRVEEALRVQRRDFTAWRDGEGWQVDLAVPGTKTASSQRQIALWPDALDLFQDEIADLPNTGHPLVGMEYRTAANEWVVIRKAMGWQDTHGATLKALRRSAARLLTAGGMPTAVLKDYLGHSSIITTQGYLELVGGFKTQEQRKWLPPTSTFGSAGLSSGAGTTRNTGTKAA